MRDSFIFYRSFYEAIKELPTSNQTELYNAIFEYSLNFNEVELSGLTATVFKLIKPQLQANIGKYNNGKKPKHKQTGSKTQAKQKQNTSKIEANVNDNVNVNANLNENVNKNNKAFTPPTLSEVILYFVENGYTEDAGKKAFNYYDSAGWKDSKGNKVKNWKQKMQGVWFKDENKQVIKSTQIRFPR